MYDMTIGHDIKKDHHHIFYFPIIKYYPIGLNLKGYLHLQNIQQKIIHNQSKYWNNN